MAEAGSVAVKLKVSYFQYAVGREKKKKGKKYNSDVFEVISFTKMFLRCPVKLKQRKTVFVVSGGSRLILNVK